MFSRNSFSSLSVIPLPQKGHAIRELFSRPRLRRFAGALAGQRIDQREAGTGGLRHENEIIVYGDYKLLAPEDEALFIYTRMLGTQRLMVLCNFTEKEVAIPAEVTEQIPADAKLLIGNYSKQKEEMLQAYEARVYAYHL